MKFLITLTLALLILSCKKKGCTDSIAINYNSQAKKDDGSCEYLAQSESEECEALSDFEHIKYFGFTLIDTYWDDPLDSINKTVYNDEVYSFSNIADILVVTPTDNIVTRMMDMNQLDMKAYIHISELFFEYVGTTSGQSGADYNLRADYQARWDAFVQANDLVANSYLLQALYLGEEPTWNDISYTELKAASDYIKSTVPDVPIMIIEAYPSISSLQVPTTVDWIGFDHYFTKNPLTNTTYQSELQELKSKFSDSTQKLVIVMDTHYIPAVHTFYGNIAESEMKDVATNYFELAKSEKNTVAVIGYTWPGGFDDSTMLGARQLGVETQEEYIRIGKLITGK